MKKAVVILALMTGFNSFGQSRITGTLFGGGAYNHTSHVLVKFGGDFHVTLPSHLFLGATTQFGVNGKTTIPNNVIRNSMFALVVGHEHQINDHFTIRPYTGFGFQSSKQTGLRYNEDLNDALDFAGDVVSVVTDDAVSVSADKRYITERHNTFGIPAGVDFTFGKRGIGVTFGYYLFVSNYSETGLKLGLTFGKIH